MIRAVLCDKVVTAKEYSFAPEAICFIDEVVIAKEYSFAPEAICFIGEVVTAKERSLRLKLSI